MLFPQVLHSRTQLARPLLQRSIRLHTPRAAAGASLLRCFSATVSEGLEGEASEPAVPSPSFSVAAELESPDNATATATTTTTTTDTTTTTTTTTTAAAAAQAQTQTPIETQTPTQAENHKQTQTGPGAQTQPKTRGNGQRRVTMRKGGVDAIPVRRVECDLHDLEAIGRAGFKVRNSSGDASYRIITLEKLLKICRDPAVMPVQHILLSKMRVNPKKGCRVLKETSYEIRYSHLLAERKWAAVAAEGAAVGRSPILEMLRVDDVETDKSKYVVVNHNLSKLGIGMQSPTREQLRSPVVSFFPRRIEQNMRSLKLAGTDPYVIMEIRDGKFHSFPIAHALGIIYNQIDTLVSNLDKKYIQTLPQVHGGQEGKIYRSMLAQMKQATEYANAILQTPIDEPISIIRAARGKPETLSHYDALMLYFAESAEAMRKLRGLVKRSILAPTADGDIVSISTEDEEYETFAEMALLDRRIINNMEAIRASAEGRGQIAVERFDGVALMRWSDAIELVLKQLESNIENMWDQIKSITGEEEGLSITPTRRGARIRSFGGVASSTPAISIPASVTTNTIPGGSREYSTSRSVSFHGFVLRRKDMPIKNAFGRNALPPKGPIVVKEGTIRHKLQLEEQKRLEAMRGLGYSLMAGGQMGGSGAGPTAEVVVKEGDGGGVDTWEGTGEFGGLNDESGLTPLKKGDLCELRMGGGPRIAIYLRPSPYGQPTSDFLLDNGERAMYAAARVTFAIPSFISEEKAGEIITTVDMMRANSDLPPQRQGELVLPRSAMADVIARMRGLWSRARALYANEKLNFVGLYERMAREDEDVELTLFEAAEEIFGEGYGDEQLYSTHLALMDDGVRYMTDKGAHRATSTFMVRAKKDVRMIEFVTEQVRLGTGASGEAGSGGGGGGGGVAAKGSKQKKQKEEVSLLESFARKARVVIDMSRRNTAEDLHVEAGHVTRVPVTEVTWDQNDIKFIDYIKAGVQQYGSQSVPMDGLVPVILRAVDRYEGELDSITAYRFVTDIGAWNRWEDLSLRQKNVRFPGMGTSRQSDADQQRVEREVGESRRAVERLGLVDSLRHIRKDWGSMEVFAIDDITAHEIDDGISLERIDDATSWVHVHIANPTAWLPPSHWLADVAFRRKQSLYLPDRVLPMLPPALTDRLGLAPNRCVMTMSAKVRMADGEVLDYVLQPGFVRNVKRFTYNAVSAALRSRPVSQPQPQPQPQPQRLNFEIGAFPAPARTDTARPNARQTADLHTLNDIALAFRRRRVKNGLINVLTPRVEVAVHAGGELCGAAFTHPAAIPATGTGTSPMPHLYRGHPAMRFTIEGSNLSPDTDGSHFLVSEMMQLANSVTAQFCGRHGIAAPFRVMEYDHERVDLMRSYLTNVLPSRDPFGSVGPELGIQYMMLIGKTRISAAPSPHRLLGLEDGYIRATSPLRRYSDMITHWQIEAFLLGRQPRTHRQITPFALELERGERLTSFTMKESKGFWAAVAIKRLMDLRDPRLPATLTFMVMEKVPHPSMSTGLVWELGMAGKVAYDNAAQEMGVKAGDTIEVEPMAALPGERMVWFKYRRVVRRRQQQLDDVFL